MNNTNDYRHNQQDDEISLVDLARVLLRRKYWIIGTFLVFTLGALAYALMQERQYSYTTSILIGEFGLDKYVAEAQGTKNVLENRIWPVIEREFVDSRDLERVPFGTSVTADEGNNFVNLKSEAPQRSQSLIEEFHSALAEALTSDHSEKLSLLERESDVRLNNLRAALETEEQQLERFQELLVNTSEVTGAATEEDEVAATAESSQQGMEAALSSSSNTLTFLLSQMQLTDQISKRQNRINDLRGRIETEELKRSWIKPTRVTNMATASISPSGTGKSLIVMLGAVLGGMLGLFMAFMAEFWSAVRNRISEEVEGS